MKNYFKITALIPLITLLCQCGFHLRGVTTLPPSFQHVFITAPADARYLQSELENQLAAYQVLICHKKPKSHFQINISRTDFRREITNISSSTTPRQFQLFYDVFFDVTDSNAHAIIPQGKMTSTRLVTMNSERLLGSNYEQDFFLHEMQSETATKIVSAIGHYYQFHHD